MKFEKEIIFRFFQMNGFFVQQDVGNIDFLIKNDNRSDTIDASDFLLKVDNIIFLNNAMVELSIWQSSPVFYPSRLKDNFKILSAKNMEQARNYIKAEKINRLILIDSLPRKDSTKKEILTGLKQIGFDYLLAFSDLLFFCIKNISKFEQVPPDFVKALNYLEYFGFLNKAQMELRLR